MSIFNDKSLKGVADAVSKILAQEAEGTHPKTQEEKKLAALAHPKDKITHKDVLVGRGVLKKEEKEKTEVEKNIENTKKTFPNVKHFTPSGHPDWKKHEIHNIPVKEETEQVEEGFADMDKYMKAKAAPQPSGGAGKKSGTRYGGSKQAPDAEEHDDEDKKPARGKYGARQNYKRSMKEGFTSMIEAYNEGGLKSLSQKLVSEEPDNEQFTKELEDQKASMEGKKKQPAVAAPATQGVKNMPEEIELNADEINGVAIETISEEVEEYEYITEEEFLQLDEDEQALWEAVTAQSYANLRDKKSKVPATQFGAKGTKTKVLDQIRHHETRKDHLTGKNVYATDYKVGKKDTAEMMYRKKSGKRGQIPSQRADVRNKQYEDVQVDRNQLDERTLTSGEKKEMEKNVKGMKKKLSGFKQRYGDRAKEVIYATATKMAKKD